MYYPYLRAKQYELKALREFAEERRGHEDRIVPIFEPVNSNIKALSTAVSDFLNYNFKFALVLNPSEGDFRHKNIRFDVQSLPESIWNTGGWIPAFLYTKNYANEISSLITDLSLTDVMIIVPAGLEEDDESAWELLGNQSVRYLVNRFGAALNRRLGRKIKSELPELDIIRFDDCFKDLPRNADYLKNEDELFSEEPFYYESDGYQGYSDYTVLPSKYVEGGMLPYAIAIHLTYRKGDQLFVHHFVSDDNFTNSDVARKFYQAASKIEPFFKRRNMTPSVMEFITRSQNTVTGYPGLGYIKKLSIKNHLELITTL